VSTVIADAVAPIAVTAPMREFLVWVTRCPRTYADTMEAWSSHCPRFTVWEDALAAGLVQVEPCAHRGTAEQRVCLTPLGQAHFAR
jgi:hypothetical protein